jgi:hypothetical protein
MRWRAVNQHAFLFVNPVDIFLLLSLDAASRSFYLLYRPMSDLQISGRHGL